MFNLTISEHTNGFSVVGYDWKTGKKVIDEIYEERIDALRVVERYFQNEIISELERRYSNAATL